MRLSGPGSNFPPTPDLAQQSKEDPQFFTGSLWLMEDGALKVRVSVDGAKGKGELSVPVAAAAQKTLKMERPLGGLLAFLMVFLAVGIIFIAGAAVREGNLRPGETPVPGRVRRARIVMAIAAVVVVGILYLGRAWWNSDASNYQRGVNLFKPPAAETKLENGNRLMIRAKGQDAEWSNYVKMEEVIPGHGHVMHLFVIRVPGLDRMWHLHPERIAGGAFAQDLPHAVQSGNADDKQVHHMAMVGNHFFHLYVIRPLGVLSFGSNHQAVSVFQFCLRGRRLEQVHTALVIAGIRVPPRSSQIENPHDDDSPNRHHTTPTPP